MQGLTLALLLGGEAVTAALVAVVGTAWLAALLAVADTRTNRACAERDAAARRVADLQRELAEAYTDPVTALPIRRQAHQYLDAATGTQLTVALVDVDDMHGVNHKGGHGFGDAYLAAVAQRLQTLTVPGDLVARLGGDEFVVVTGRAPQALADALAAMMRHPVSIGAVGVPVRISVGIAQVDGGNAHTALGRADLAMFAAKRTGGGIAHYDPHRHGIPHPHGHRPPVRHRDRRHTGVTDTRHIHREEGRN